MESQRYHTIHTVRVSFITGNRLQQLEGCQSLWHHRRANSVCVITITALQQRQMFHTVRLGVKLAGKKMLMLNIFICINPMCVMLQTKIPLYSLDSILSFFVLLFFINVLT